MMVEANKIALISRFGKDILDDIILIMRASILLGISIWWVGTKQS
jgi:hypothetical protein